MKEDILEQAVDDWLLSQPGTFTKHNIKFKPSVNDPEFKKGSDAVNSDIDVLAIHTNKKGADRISVITCKSWQNGFNPHTWFDMLTKTPNKNTFGKPAWKVFRELVKRKWGKALAETVFNETGSYDFTYYVVVTKLAGKESEEYKDKFENDKSFLENLRYDRQSLVKVRIITFKEIFDEHFARRNTQTLEATELGRLIQILKASGVELKKNE